MAAPSPSGSTCDAMAGTDPQRLRLIDVELDDTIGRSTPDVEHERAVAIFDLIEENSFCPVNDTGEGPYRLKLSLVEARLVFAIARENGEEVVTHILSLTPFRRIVERLLHDLRELLRGDPQFDASARSRRSTWAGAACTTKARRR